MHATIHTYMYTHRSENLPGAQRLLEVHAGLALGVPRSCPGIYIYIYIYTLDTLVSMHVYMTLIMNTGIVVVLTYA